MLETNQGCLPAGSAKKIYYTLRIASAMCFIGHGAFGIITKEIWTHYFGVFGIGHDTAYAMMPYVGVIDICMGVSLLLYPTRIILGWLVIWGLITALLRPLSGEPFAEFIERAGNFGVPLTLLLLTSQQSIKNKNWFNLVKMPEQIDKETLNTVALCLRIVVFLLFTGHGLLNLIEKKALLDQYKSLGFSNPANIAHIVGALEILGTLSILIRPLRPMIFLLFIWKAASELFYPHWELFEWIERGGSYGAVLALWFTINELKFDNKIFMLIKIYSRFRFVKQHRNFIS
jgi:uncharacterized membrane protein YphA (DoxX/SURF4 family)